jgi:hypothetical protein
MPVGNPQLDRLRAATDRVRVRMERLISGRAPSDPLYLTNRTWQQKMKTAALVGVPLIILMATIAIAATDVFHLHKTDAYEHPLTEAQPVAPQNKLPEPKLVPADLEVVNIRIAKDAHPPVVTGILRNNTNAKVDSAQVSYYLADTGGSLVGTDTIDVQNVQPHSSVTFHVPLKTASAQYVIVREVRTN